MAKSQFSGPIVSDNGFKNSTTGANLGEVVLNLDIADLSAEDVYYVPVTHAGTVRVIYSCIDAAVSTADVTITAGINGTDITTGVVTIATAASASGDVDSATPTALNTVAAGDYIDLTVTGGGAGGTPAGHIAIVITL